jgi:hypothetical protein
LRLALGLVFPLLQHQLTTLWLLAVVLAAVMLEVVVLAVIEQHLVLALVHHLQSQLAQAGRPLLVALELMETLEIIQFLVLLLLLAAERGPRAGRFAMEVLALAALMALPVLGLWAKVTTVELGLLMVQLMPLVAAAAVLVQLAVTQAQALAVVTAVLGQHHPLLAHL